MAKPLTVEATNNRLFVVSKRCLLLKMCTPFSNNVWVKSFIGFNTNYWEWFFIRIWVESTNTTACLISSFKVFLYILSWHQRIKFLIIIRDSKGEEGVFVLRSGNVRLALLIKSCFRSFYLTSIQMPPFGSLCVYFMWIWLSVS